MMGLFYLFYFWDLHSSVWFWDLDLHARVLRFMDACGSASLTAGCFFRCFGGVVMGVMGRGSLR